MDFAHAYVERTPEKPSSNLMDFADDGEGKTSAKTTKQKKRFRAPLRTEDHSETYRRLWCLLGEDPSETVGENHMDFAHLRAGMAPSDTNREPMMFAHVFEGRAPASESYGKSMEFARVCIRGTKRRVRKKPWSSLTSAWGGGPS